MIDDVIEPYYHRELNPQALKLNDTLYGNDIIIYWDLEHPFSKHLFQIGSRFCFGFSLLNIVIKILVEIIIVYLKTCIYYIILESNATIT